MVSAFGDFCASVISCFLLNLGRFLGFHFFPKKNTISAMKKAPGCLGYMSGMTSYPVIWGLFHQP